MKVKRYEAPTLQEALLNVKRDLGSEAVILQTRKFNRGGFLGIRRQDVVEVLAATDVNTPGSPSPSPAQSRPRNTSQLQKKTIEKRSAAAGGISPSGHQSSRPSPHKTQLDRNGFRPRTSGNGSGDSAETKALREELRQMRESLQELVKQRQIVPGDDDLKPYPRVFGDIYLRLIENDVEDKIAQDIIRYLDEYLPEDRKNDERQIFDALARQLRRMIKVSGPIELQEGTTKCVAFVGPTGVGKTTTIAKLATIFSMSNKKRVGIITADTFRIAAVEQIKVYSDIINVPIKVVYNRDDMKHALDYFSDRDLVFIDTAGRSHWDTERIAELREVLSACYPLEIHLTVSANTKYRDMLDVAEKFRVLSYNNLLFTKLDETSSFGSLINLISMCNVGVSYLCYGQSVPGEIQAATVESMMGLIIGKPLSKIVDSSGKIL